MRDVEVKCTTTAELEELGLSKSSNAAYFLGDLTGSGPSSAAAELGKISATFCGERACVFSVKKRAVVDDTRVSGID